MPAGLAQRLPRREDPRAAHQALFDRFGEPAIGAAGIADRREAALQHAFEHRAACKVTRLTGCSASRASA